MPFAGPAMHALAVPVFVIICLALCPAQGTGLAEEQDREDALALGLPNLPGPQGRDAPPTNSLLAFLLSLFSRNPQHSTDAFSRQSERGSNYRSPKRLYYAPRLGKREPAVVVDNSETRREKRDTTAEEDEEESNNSGYSWWWPRVTVRRSPFVPRAGKREDSGASDLYDATDLQEDMEGYVMDDQIEDTSLVAKRGNGFAFSPRLGKRGNFAFTPRLGKRDFAFVPRAGKRGDFAFTPRLGKREADA